MKNIAQQIEEKKELIEEKEERINTLQGSINLSRATLRNYNEYIEKNREDIKDFNKIIKKTNERTAFLIEERKKIENCLNDSVYNFFTNWNVTKENLTSKKKNIENELQQLDNVEKDMQSQIKEKKDSVSDAIGKVMEIEEYIENVEEQELNDLKQVKTNLENKLNALELEFEKEEKNPPMDETSTHRKEKTWEDLNEREKEEIKEDTIKIIELQSIMQEEQAQMDSLGAGGKKEYTDEELQKATELAFSLEDAEDNIKKIRSKNENRGTLHLLDVKIETIRGKEIEQPNDSIKTSINEQDFIKREQKTESDGFFSKLAQGIKRLFNAIKNFFFNEVDHVTHQNIALNSDTTNGHDTRKIHSTEELIVQLGGVKAEENEGSHNRKNNGDPRTVLQKDQAISPHQQSEASSITEKNQQEDRQIFSQLLAKNGFLGNKVKSLTKEKEEIKKDTGKIIELQSIMQEEQAKMDSVGAGGKKEYTDEELQKATELACSLQDAEGNIEKIRSKNKDRGTLQLLDVRIETMRGKEIEQPNESIKTSIKGPGFIQGSQKTESDGFFSKLSQGIKRGFLGNKVKSLTKEEAEVLREAREYAAQYCKK